MSGEIWFDPTSDKLVLRDGEHYLEVPRWAREIIGNEFERVERETRQLRELVREMWHEGAFAPGACYVETDRLEERTRELGVEVDE